MNQFKDYLTVSELKEIKRRIHVGNRDFALACIPIYVSVILLIIGNVFIFNFNSKLGPFNTIPSLINKCLFSMLFAVLLGILTWGITALTFAHFNIDANTLAHQNHDMMLLGLTKRDTMKMSSVELESICDTYSDDHDVDRPSYLYNRRRKKFNQMSMIERKNSHIREADDIPEKDIYMDDIDFRHELCVKIKKYPSYLYNTPMAPEPDIEAPDKDYLEMK